MSNATGMGNREAGFYPGRPAFPAGRYFLCTAIMRRPGGLTFCRTEGRVFAPSEECAIGIVQAELGLDFKPEDIKVRLSEVPPIAFIPTYQRPASAQEWEEFKNADI